MNILDKIHLGSIWVRSVIAEEVRWRYRRTDNRAPRVFFGMDHLPDGGGQEVFGGLVKLLDLNGRFRNCKTDPNILYLVSSALPYFPEMMGQRAKKAGAKLVINQNGVAYPAWHGSGWERTNRPMKRLLEMADYVIYQSRFCQISAEKYLGEHPHLISEVLYNPVDTSFFTPLGRRPLPASPVRILVAGSHWSAYRIFVAVETLSKIRNSFSNIAMRIAGRFCWRTREAQALEEVKQYARELRVDDLIEFCGAYSQQDAPELMRSCSLLLHTKYNDPCPRLVVEAMACGLPVVYSATGGVPELVGEEAGYGVPGPLDWEEDHPPDADNLAIGIEKVLSDLNTYSYAARQRAVDYFDVGPWLDRHAEIFEGVL